MHPFFHITESLSIPAYGLFIVAAMLSAIALGCHLATRVGVPFWKMVDLAFQFCIAGEIGARLVFLIVEWRALVEGEIPFRQFLVAGRVVLGAVAGGALFSLWLFRKHRLPVLALVRLRPRRRPARDGDRTSRLPHGRLLLRQTDLFGAQRHLRRSGGRSPISLVRS